MSTSIQSYSFIAKLLHWLMAFLLLLNGLLALTDEWWPESQVRTIIDLHKSLGILLLFLVALRVIWRLTHKPPQLPTAMADWERQLATLGHILLYVLIVLIPITGWLHDSAWKDAASHPLTLFGIVPWPRIGFLMALDPATKDYWHHLLGIVHTVLNYALYILLSLHLIAVYKHERLDKIKILPRMGFKRQL